jgi:hypothetical protein
MVAYRHDIDDFIIRRLAWRPRGWDYGEHIKVIAMFRKRLLELIKRTWPTISEATFQEHLDRMVEHDILKKGVDHLYPDRVKSGTGKCTIYSLSRNAYVNIRDCQGHTFPRVKSNREPRAK